MRGVAAGVCLVAALAPAGCTNGSTTERTTTCGTPYLFKIHNQAVAVGSCAGILPTTPSDATMRVGDKFTVSIIESASGEFLFPVPTPDSSAVTISKHDKHGVTYAARSTGEAVLNARTIYCGITDDGAHPSPVASTCPALRVHVLPR